MTRQERENNLRIGDDVEFKTNSGLLERVVIDIGEKAVKLLLKIWGKENFKRIH